MEFENAYNNPLLYDKENEKICDDIKFWELIVKTHNIKNVLEVGCGTGRIAKHIINYVSSYTGIDMSKNFIDYFYKNFKSNKIKLICDNVISYSFNQRFDCIILPANFISHFEKNDEVENLLYRLSLCLENDGIIVIDYYNPQLRFLDMNIKKVFCYDFEYDNEKIRVYESHNYNEFKQVNTIERFYYSGDKLVNKSKLPIRVFFRQELEYIINKSELKINQVYGDYDCRNIELYSPKLIYILGLCS